LNEEDLVVDGKSTLFSPKPGSRSSRKRLKVSKKTLVTTLKHNRGHVVNSAAEIGISRAKAYVLLRRYNITPEEFRT